MTTGGLNNRAIGGFVLKRLADHTRDISRSLERLSTGLRINSAGDDAAGLALSEDLNTKARLFSQARRNVADAISLTTVAGSSLEALTSIITRQKELALQAANGVYSLNQRKALNAEADALTNEYNRN